MVLMIVLLVMLVITLLSVGLVSQSIGQLPLARSVEDHQAAVQAAQSGVEDYLSLLNTQANYWMTASHNVTTWTPVPGVPSAESFRYSADVSTTMRDGIITITADGCSTAKVVAGVCPGVTQTVRESVRRAGFLDDVYFTDYEIVDPNLLDNTTCGNPPNHQWQGSGPNSNCQTIQFATGDTLNGPVHSNDAFHICGNPVFLGPVDSYYNSSSGTHFAGPGTILKPGNCSAHPSWTRSGDPAAGLDLPMPTVNSLAAQVNPKLVPPGTIGCLFSGATTLALRYTAGGVGYIDYSSPNTDFRASNTTWNAALCGTPVSPATSGSIPTATLSGGLWTGAQVMYVQNVPSGNPKFATCALTCPGDATIGNTTAALLPTGQSGGLAGQLTVGTDDSITVTNNTTYRSYPTGNDLLGLIATNYVIVSHPPVTTCDGTGHNCVTTYPGAGETPGTGLTIDASILALNHSFYVDNWDQGSSLGILTVNGGIAQEFRGPVGTSGGTGYLKAYAYDARLAYMSPPYYATPSIVSWHKTAFAALNTCAIPSASC
jgi:hypothetical protein